MNFYDWLNEEVDWNGHGINRWKMIRLFVTEGLMPLMEKYGYFTSSRLQYIQDCLATGLFENEGLSHSESDWHSVYTYDNSSDLDATAHFHHVVGQAEWDTFWLTWGSWSDVSLQDFRGQDRQFDIQNFIWEHIDLSKSPQMKVLTELLTDPYEEDITGRYAWQPPEYQIHD